MSSSALAAVPRMYFDVDESDELHLVVDGKSYDPSWLGFYSIDEAVASHRAARDYFAQYDEHLRYSWYCYGAAIGSFIGAASVESDQATIGLNIAGLGLVVGWLHLLSKAQADFLRGMNAYNGVYDSKTTAGLSSNTRLFADSTANGHLLGLSIDF